MTVPAPAKSQHRYHAVILVMLACSILCALGTWQLQRLSWKRELIATLEHKLATTPVDFTTLDAPLAAHEWTRVTVDGVYEAAGQATVAPRTLDGKVGVHVFAPLRMADGRRVMINRGFAAQEQITTVATPEGRVELQGVVRKATRARFTPDNNPAAGQWYWPEASAMLGADGGVIDVYVQLDESDDKAGRLVPVAVTPDLPNNHAQYAAFWFGMAGLCLLIFVLARRKGYA